MRSVFLMLFCSVLLAGPGVASAGELSGYEYSEAMLLLNPTDFDVRLAAKSIHRLSRDRADIMDLVAEVTWTVCSGKRKMDPGTLSWLAKTLGRSKQARYAGLLDACLSSITDPKTLKYMQQARDALEGTATNPFVGGQMDLAAMRARLPQKAGPASRSQLAMQFAELHFGQPLNEVYSALGTPTDVSGSNIGGNKVGFIFVKVRTSEDMIVFGYKDIGTINFYYDGDKAIWLLSDASSDKGLLWNWQTGHFGTLSDLIARGGVIDLREVMKRLSTQKNIDRDTLDHIAERIYRSRNETDGVLADTLAKLCYVIEKTRDGRYKQVLLDVSDTAETSTLRKHSGRVAKNLPDTTDANYVPPPEGQAKKI